MQTINMSVSNQTNREMNIEKFRDLLNIEFLKRKEQNPKYSLRGFAFVLGVDQSYLCKFLKGKRNISAETIFRMALAIQLPTNEIEKLVCPDQQRFHKVS